MFDRVGFCLFLALGLASAQTKTEATGTFTGVVKDPHDALVVGSKITVTGARFVIKERTDAAGRFRIADLRPGVYSIRIETGGAIPFIRNNIQLAGGQEQKFDVTLWAGKDPIHVLTVVEESPKRKK